MKCFPNGIPYPMYLRANILSSSGTLEEICQKFGCLVSTITRLRRLYIETGTFEGGRKNRAETEHVRKTLTSDDCYSLVCLVNLYPQCTLKEMQSYLLIGQRVSVSTSTICRELKRCGFSRKNLNRFSIFRQEPSRIAWWVNPPDLNGCAGVRIDDLASQRPWMHPRMNPPGCIHLD